MTDTPGTTTPPTASPLPAPPGAPVNPNSGSYTDHHGNTRALLSTSQLQSERAGWLDIFDRQAKDRFAPGYDASKFTPEARAAWAAKFDAAALGDNLIPTEAPSADVIRQHEDFGLPVQTSPADYKPVLTDLAQTLPHDRFANVISETTAMAAEIGFSPELGTAVIQHIAELGPRLATMTEEARTEWVDRQDQFNLQRAGSEDALAEMKTRAKAVLESAKGSKLAANIAKSSWLSDPWLLATLANHSRAVEAFAAAQK